MDYFVTKKLNNKEWRVYFSDESQTPGRILFKGRKELLTVEIVSDILEYRIERSTGTYHFVDYGKVGKTPNIRDKEMWFSGTNPIELIQKSWQTLEDKLQVLNPNSKKIMISQNFI